MLFVADEKRSNLESQRTRTSSSSSRGTKRMKKRKELDALLTMANGKKNGKSKRSKEGHELLRLDSDSNSSDNDELFLAPKKTVIRRPRPCQCCSTCVPLVMFVLTVACIVVTAGLIWMHFNLKKDLDDLRTKLEKVEQQSQEVSSQSSTLLDLESRLERLADIGEQVDSSVIKIKKLNGTIRNLSSKHAEIDKWKTDIEVKVSSSTSTIQQTVADFGNQIQELDGKISDQKTEIDTVKNDISTLRTQVDTLLAAATTQSPSLTVQPTQASVVLPPEQPSTVTPEANSGSIIVVREELTKVWDAIGEINSTVDVLSTQGHQLAVAVASLQSPSEGTVLPTTGPSTAPQSIQIGQHDLDKMHADIEFLKAECNRSRESPHSSKEPVSGRTVAVNNTQMEQIADRITRLEERVDTLNPEDLNNNLLNLNTTHGIEQILESSFQKFQDQTQSQLTDFGYTLTGLQNDVRDQKMTAQEIGARIEGIEDQIVTLREQCQTCTQGAGPEAAGTQTPNSNTQSNTEQTGRTVPPEVRPTSLPKVPVTNDTESTSQAVKNPPESTTADTAPEAP